MSNLTIRRLDWTCAACGEPIYDGQGSFAVSKVGVQDALRIRDEFGSEPVRIRDALHFVTGMACWQPAHDSCRKLFLELHYDIPVERLRTPRDVLAWTAHLIGKNWLSVTDWRDWLYRVAPLFEEAA